MSVDVLLYVGLSWSWTWFGRCSAELEAIGQAPSTMQAEIPTYLT